ncbi:unnamed protein product [Rotaria socialis]
MQTFNELHESNTNSDSENDSALMQDAHSEVISSSITTNGSSSLSDDESFLIISKTKPQRIEKFLNRRNKRKLIKCAKITGLINELYRKQIWPLILNSPSYCTVEYDNNKKLYFCPIDYYSADKEQIESHRYYGQVRMDVERTLKRFPPNYSDSGRIELQEKLIVVVIKMLIKHDYLNYYQGYHDICLTFLLVLGADLCLPFIDTVTKSHFKGGVGNVMFALSWFITWYSHVLNDLDVILRLYDLFIVSHFLMPIYVAAEIVNYHADQVLSIDCDMPSLHQYLTRLPSELDSNTWEEIINRSSHLFRNHHPDTLDVLNDEWIKKCESIDHSPMEVSLRRRYGKDSFENDNDGEKSAYTNDRNEHQGALPRIVLWGVTLTISGLAIYIWNHTQRTDPTTFISLGDFLAQLYGK